LKRYCWERVLDIVTFYPEKRSLVIDFMDVERFDLDVAKELIDNPDIVLKHATDALEQIDLPIDLEAWHPSVRVCNVPNKIRRRDLREQHIDRLVSIDGVVIRISEVEPKISVAAFKCQRCDHVSYVPQSDRQFHEPFECESDVCGRKGPFKLLSMESEKVDYQRIRLQELTEELRGGEKGQTIDIDAVDDLAGVALPGNKITVTGILRAYQRVKVSGKTPFLDFVIDAVHIQLNEGQVSLVLTPIDLSLLKQIASKPDVVDRLVSSFACSIHGMPDVKEGMLCCAVSSGQWENPDGTRLRDLSHMLVISDPGMAKSSLKNALKKEMPQILLGSGTGASKVGLTAAVVKDDFSGKGSYSLEAGVLALADGGGAVIDEFDKLNEEDKRKLNDALSDCQFEIDKAGFHVRLWSRCFVIAFQNPKLGRFDPYEPIPKQLNVPPDTLTRFDLIFLLNDVVNMQNDAQIIRKMSYSRTGKIVEMTPEISGDLFRKYLVYAKSINPLFNDDVVSAIENEYVTVRQMSTNGQIAVTPRFGESLFRLAKAEAKLHLSNTVEMSHYKRARALLFKSLKQIGTDEKGNMDADIITGHGKSQRDRIRYVLQIIKEVAQNNKGVAPVGEVVLEAEKQGIKDNYLISVFDELKRIGEIFEPVAGVFRVGAP
jgi:replicative DNA helicase Mcm